MPPNVFSGATFGPRLVPKGVVFYDGDAIVRDLFFGTSGGYPLGPILASLGHPWSDFVDFLQDFKSKIGPKFKDSRATNNTNHTSKKTGKDSRTTLPIISSSKSLFTVVV